MQLARHKVSLTQNGISVSGQIWSPWNKSQTELQSTKRHCSYTFYKSVYESFGEWFLDISTTAPVDPNNHQQVSFPGYSHLSCIHSVSRGMWALHPWLQLHRANEHGSGPLACCYEPVSLLVWSWQSLLKAASSDLKHGIYTSEVRELGYGPHDQSALLLLAVTYKLYSWWSTFLDADVYGVSQDHSLAWQRDIIAIKSYKMADAGWKLG